jgi:hypothetical protein
MRTFLENKLQFQNYQIQNLYFEKNRISHKKNVVLNNFSCLCFCLNLKHFVEYKYKSLLVKGLQLDSLKYFEIV